MRERVSWTFAQVVFWSCLALGVTVLGVTSLWGGLALLGVGLLVPIWRGWPNIWRMLQGKPPHPTEPGIPDYRLGRAAIIAVGDGSSVSLKRVGVHGFESAVAIRGAGGKVTAEDTEMTAPGTTFAGVGRNQRCPCGSGKRFKKCHGKE